MANVSEFDYLCRLCATKILMGLPIFHDDLTDDQIRNIDKKITTCLPVQVSMSDQLPKAVCEDCAFKLDQLYDFREKCVETDKFFKTMLTKVNIDIIHHSLDDNCVMILPEVQDGMTDIHNDIGDLTCTVDNNDEDEEDNDNVNDENKDNVYNNDETNGSTIHTLQVMDDMDIGGGEQVVGQEEISRVDGDIEVGIDELDGDTARLVDQHIREAANHEMTLDIDGEMTVVGHLAINYVTNINSESPAQEQLVQYCDDVKFQTVTNNSFNQPDQIDDNEVKESLINDNITTEINTNNVPSTSQNTEVSSEITEYTKCTKHELLESALNNPSIVDTDSHWYICPFCNEASNEPENLAMHYEQHFCSCPCGLYFTSIADLIQHKNHCSKKESNNCENNQNDVIKFEVRVLNNKNNINNTNGDDNDDNEEDEDDNDGDVDDGNINVNVNVNDDGDDNDNDNGDDKIIQQNIRQKWTPKICQHCGKQYRTNYKLQEHMRKHTGEKPFKCTTCEKAFRSKIGLAQHTATHTGQFDYSCSTCGKGFQCKSYLIVHQRVHSDLKPYPCETCGQNFKTKQSLLDHQNRHLGVKPYRCDVCGRAFITKGLCKSHQKTHSGQDNRQYPCEVCSKMFVSKSYLNTHLRIHTGEKPYLCEVCGKGFLTRVDLKIHSTMHTGEKSFKCEYDSCNKAFARKSALRCHIRSHNGERPYKCDVCSKAFTQFSPLAIHKRLHSGVKPYVCDICSKAFVSRSSMMCHRKRHTKATTVQTTTTDNPETVNGDDSIIVAKIEEIVDELK